ncbi:MAG: glycosyltransferase family 2 protein [Acidimicrobiia bacterium]|nr:glycosyltransferase family 2 protein [Acidimicrobiia bacterium]
MTALDIIIVNYNTVEDLRACLRSLHTSPPARPHHVCVVDNASADGSVAAVRSEFPGVEVVALDANVGFAAANNIGIRRTSAPLVLLLNSDTVVPAGALDTLIDRLDATRATAAGPRLVDAHGRPEISWGPMLSPLAEAGQACRVRLARTPRPWAQRLVARWTTRERWVDWVTGACLLVRRSAALDAGLLDERYFMYEEDVDFCAALRARGGRILFAPAAQVVHRRGRSFAVAGTRPSPLYDRSHMAFYKKHHPLWAPILRVWLRLRRRGDEAG